MPCALCTRTTLSTFICSLLKDSRSRSQIVQAHTSLVVHTRRPNIPFVRKSLHTSRVWCSALAIQHSCRLEYNHLPFVDDRILPESQQNEHNLVSLSATNFATSQSGPGVARLKLQVCPDTKGLVQIKNPNDDERIHSIRRRRKMEREPSSDGYISPGRLARKERNRTLITARRLAKSRGTNQEISAVLRCKIRADAHVNARTDIIHEHKPGIKSGKNKSDLDERNLRSTTVASSRFKPEPWQVQKAAMQSKLKGQKWNPQKRLSPEALEGIRALHAQYPNQFSTPALADHFKISPEAIRRILKGKWRPNESEDEERLKRWDKRGEKIWTSKVKDGIHPPKRWREMGIGAGPRRKAQDWSLERP